jgi:hypothetical protein
MIPPHRIRQLANQYARHHSGEKPDCMVFNPSDLMEEGLQDRIFLMASPAMPKGYYWIGVQADIAKAVEDRKPLP